MSYKFLARILTLLQLELLPDEILQLIVSGLSTHDLRNAALVSKCVYRHASDLLWQNVCLVDSWRLHVSEDTRNTYCERGQGESDEHDDTPIIQKLFILASYVQPSTVIH
jgi:hypothetical protein